MTEMIQTGEARLLATGFSFLEAARWHEGNFYASDYYTGRVMRFDRSDRPTLLCEVPNQPSGLGFAPDRTLLISSMLDKRILAYRDGKLTEHADLSQLAPAPINDMIVDAEGRCFVGNFGSDVHLGEAPLPTSLIRVDPDGFAAVVAEDLRFPNGMAITRDGSTLLVSETLGSRILAFDLDADGGLSGRRIWAQLSEPGPMDFEAAIAVGAFLPDGICLAGEDGIWVADAAGRGTVRVEEGGNLSDQVDTGDYTAYAVVVGGEEGKTLFICAGAALGEVDPTETLAATLLSCELDGRPQGGR